MPQTVWIARHGNRLDFVNPDWFNTAARPYDPPLSEDGIVQAQELGDRLRGAGIRHIFASPFLRTVQTAHEVAKILDRPLWLEAGLSEWLNPAWMPTYPETEAREILAAQYTTIDLSYSAAIQPHYPESEADVAARTAKTVQHLVGHYREDLLLVGHGASVLGTAHGLVAGKPEIQASFCCLVQIVATTTSWQLLLNGDTSHLSQTEQRVRFN
ncbi:MAG: histidine phosphatase family protein [Spirulinaceae cyanobacterium SM2_1_0]|nr:histidine phosphatase family protein [Spirulinaceae cyanobacterium SM2_1_0]